MPKLFYYIVESINLLSEYMQSHNNQQTWHNIHIHVVSTVDGDCVNNELYKISLAQSYSNYSRIIQQNVYSSYKVSFSFSLCASTFTTHWLQDKLALRVLHEMVDPKVVFDIHWILTCTNGKKFQPQSAQHLLDIIPSVHYFEYELAKGNTHIGFETRSPPF